MLAKMDVAMDHEEFTMLAKRQPGWTPTFEGAQQLVHLDLFPPAPDGGLGLSDSLCLSVSICLAGWLAGWLSVSVPPQPPPPPFSRS